MTHTSDDIYDNSGSPLISSGSKNVPAYLSIGLFACSNTVAESLREFLSCDRYNLTELGTIEELFDFLEKHKYQIDCLVLQDNRSVIPTINLLYERGMVLPTVILQAESEDATFSESQERDFSVSNTHNVEVAYRYHPAEVLLPINRLSEIGLCIDQAIAEFLKLSPNYRLSDSSDRIQLKTELTNPPHLLKQQRLRLAEKLKERLGYLAVYYKRNPHHFFRNLPHNEKQTLLDEIKFDYCQIVLNYFSQELNLNDKIDDFVTLLFFSDFPIPQVVEIHMELMDDFAHQLKVEGRSEDILLDYRLTLIDVIAHLCEMYRRSIPREL